MTTCRAGRIGGRLDIAQPPQDMKADHVRFSWLNHGNALALGVPAWQFQGMTSPADKCKVFRKLHESGCFVIPNPWSPGTARYLEGLGFKALASTSSGYAHSQGYSDGALTLDQVLTHYREIASATLVPVNADFENGFAHEPADVALNVKRCIETGVAGLSIEDYSNDNANPIYDFDFAVTRMKAARKAIDEMGGSVVLTGRAEGVLHGVADLTDAIKRIRAYSEAGADCLYVPGIKTREQIVEVVKAAGPKPVNLLNHTNLGFTVKEIAGMGVRRISVGGTLSRVAMDAFIKSARDIAENGSFDSFAGVVSNAELNKFFGDGPKKDSK
jgi:2-methylisocitrate lyase-like PEP mutase family enzyme